VFEAAPNPYLLLAADAPAFTIVAANDAYLRATMTRREAIVGRGLFGAFPDNPGDPAATGARNLRASLERVVAARAPDRMAEQRYDIRRPPEDGGGFEERWWSPLNVPVFAPDGTLWRILHHVEDATAHRRAERRLRESERRFNGLIRASGQVLYSMSADWSEMRQLTGGGFITDTGQPRRDWLEAYIDPDDRARLLAAVGEAVRTKGVFELEHRVRRVDGSLGWTLSRAVPLLSEAGDIEEWVGAASDITGRKEVEGALARHRTGLERMVEERTAALLREVEERRKAEESLRQGEKLQAVGQLTGGIAHDFNNILQVVSSGAQLLKLPRLAEEKRAVVLDGMIKASQNAKELTARLLAFARKQTLQPAPFDLNARLGGMSELLRSTLGSRGRVETDFAPDLWPAMADPGQLEVAVLNLAANARDAMQPGGGTLTFTTRNAALDATPERAGGDYVRLAVKDTGKGMPPAVLARVFEPFFTTKGVDKGTGLGLAQAHGFAKQSRGDIAVESVVGGGTTVTFHLPRATVAVTAVAPPPEKGTGGGVLERSAGRTVLVVDDNPDVAAFAAAMLEALGFATRRAANAAEALAAVEEGGPVDAVFSDVVMPGAMDGARLATELRRRFPRLPVVLATGYSEVLAEGGGQAVAEVLGKPYRLDDLAAAMERAFLAVGNAPMPAPEGNGAGEKA